MMQELLFLTTNLTPTRSAGSMTNYTTAIRASTQANHAWVMDSILTAKYTKRRERKTWVANSLFTILLAKPVLLGIWRLKLGV